MSSRDSLDEIVDECFSGEVSWVHDQLDGTSYVNDSLKDIEKRKIEAKQAIHQWTLDEVIGRDDPPSVWSKVDGAIRNKLRAEQRAKLKGDIDES